MDLKESMASGVFVEFFDAAGNCLGQAVYLDWCGRPIPTVGDVISCDVPGFSKRQKGKLTGRIRLRHYEMQHDDEGRPCVWVRLEVDAAVLPRSSRRGSRLASRRWDGSFSAN